MGKKFIIVKIKTCYRLYTKDLRYVRMFEKKKTPRLPPYEEIVPSPNYSSREFCRDEPIKQTPGVL